MSTAVLTVPQAAEKLQMNPAIVRQYLRSGKMPGRKIGKVWRVLESDLELWISSGQSERKQEFVPARGLLKKYPGTLTSEEVSADKRLDAELEEAKLSKPADRVRRSA